MTKQKKITNLEPTEGWVPESQENMPQEKNPEPQDPWAHRSEYMRCRSCMWYVNFRCRKHAPTMNGYPAVYPSDWCGDHKCDKVVMGGY